ncbi:DUF5691 domain-containing protein [Deinococcus yavapaiensis]|uniref:Uncharacterized protein n=1 Tax=Deinococcus yavapaiensis KR-236 TaxID=694435 RepID=A0A318S857_9DEIO|nr:DUF5691 domain-containing protein [Deinococcus yavapaiensis]PYE53918.1 hypothetical protein DES52_107176 [Deinococcus yavapaiensis KR-236]
MSGDLRELAAVATRGTSRADLPAPTGPLAAALTAVPGDTPEALLLGRAALLGLHARAGASLGRAAALPPTPLPPPERPLPADLAALLPALLRADPALIAEALRTVAARGWTLNAAHILAVHGQNANLAHALWTLADARARVTLDAHSLHKQARKAEEDATWAASLRALGERRATNPEAAARELQAQWAEQPAERRKELLTLVRRDLRQEDRALLEAATRDRSPDLQKQARQLLGHLPGPLQDELLRLLPQAVKVSGFLKQKITFGAFDLPAALGKPRAGQYDDSDLHRLLGALPTPLVLTTLNVRWDDLHHALRSHHWSLAQELQAPQSPAPPPLDVDTARARVRDLAGQPSVTAEKLLDAVRALAASTDLSAEPPALQAALATRTLNVIQIAGLTPSARELTRLLRLTLSPDVTIPPPTPRAFELPPRPKQLPTWQTPAAWEERQRQEHAQKETSAVQAYADLVDTWRVRRAWRAALAAHPTS